MSNRKLQIGGYEVISLIPAAGGWYKVIALDDTPGDDGRPRYVIADWDGESGTWSGATYQVKLPDVYMCVLTIMQEDLP